MFRSPPTRGAWIEIGRQSKNLTGIESPPTRGAWIEIRWSAFLAKSMQSRPPHGGRGLKCDMHTGKGRMDLVAPHTGGVD